METRLEYKAHAEVVIETDCAVVFHKHRTHDGYIRGELFDEKNSSQGLFKTKFLNTPGLAACMAIYIVSSEDQIFLLHASLAQAKENKNSEVKPYFHLKDRLKGAIVKVRVYGHIENFDESVFRQALKNYGIQIKENCSVQLIKPPVSDGLYNGEFNFIHYKAQIEIDTDHSTAFAMRKAVKNISPEDFSTSPNKTAISESPIVKEEKHKVHEVKQDKPVIPISPAIEEKQCRDHHAKQYECFLRKQPSRLKRFISFLSQNKRKIFLGVMIALFVVASIFSAGAIPVALAGLSTAFVVSAGFAKIAAVAGTLCFGLLSNIPVITVIGIAMLSISFTSPWWLALGLKKLWRGTRNSINSPLSSSDEDPIETNSEKDRDDINPYRAMPDDMLQRDSSASAVVARSYTSHPIGSKYSYLTPPRSLQRSLSESEIGKANSHKRKHS